MRSPCHPVTKEANLAGLIRSKIFCIKLHSWLLLIRSSYEPISLSSSSSTIEVGSYGAHVETSDSEESHSEGIESEVDGSSPSIHVEPAEGERGNADANSSFVSPYVASLLRTPLDTLFECL